MSEVPNQGAAPEAVSEEVAENSSSAVGNSPAPSGNALEPDFKGMEADSSEEANPIDQAVKEAKKEEIRRKKLKLKVNGKEIEKEINFDDEDSLREMMQKALAADEKFQKSSQLEKQMAMIAQMLQEDPVALLREAGHDVDALTEQYLQKRVEEMQKSPEQLELEKFQKQLEEKDKKLKQIEQERFEEQQAKMQEEYARNLNDEITEGLSTTDLPKSPYVVKRIAEVLMVGLDQGRDLSVKDVIPYVQKQIKGEIQQMFEAMPEDVIEAVLGDNVSKKLRNRRLQQAKKKVETAKSVKPTGQAEIEKAKARATQEAKPVSAKDFFKNLG